MKIMNQVCVLGGLVDVFQDLWYNTYLAIPSSWAYVYFPRDPRIKYKYTVQSDTLDPLGFDSGIYFV
jgi:hypothetical protein